jgi:hypothetical protein
MRQAFGQSPSSWRRDLGSRREPIGRAARQLSSLRLDRIHTHLAACQRVHPQKSIKRSAGITSVQELLEQLWDRRTGKIVNAHAMGRPHDDRLRCRSRRPIQGAKK